MEDFCNECICIDPDFTIAFGLDSGKIIICLYCPICGATVEGDLLMIEELYE